MSGLLVHWQLAIAAVAAGAVLGVLVLAALYGAPLARVRLAGNPEDRARVLEAEAGRLHRLLDAAAVMEEHGRSSEAGELRAEAEIRALLLAWAVPRSTGHQLRSWPSSEPGPRRD